MDVPKSHSLESGERDDPAGAQELSNSEPVVSESGPAESAEILSSPAGASGTTPTVRTGRHEEMGAEVHSNPISLRDLLAGYDREVEVSLREALGSTTGVGRVRVLHNMLRRSISVHDAVLESALCPVLEDLPGGPAVAERLRQGCHERAELLGRFEKLSHNVAAHNVYPVSGEEIERILEGLERSFGEHISIETTEVGALLEAAAGSVDPDVLGARMAIEAQQAPTRAHAATVKHPRSSVLRTVYRSRDRFRDWSDSHSGWSDPQAAPRSPRDAQVELLTSQSTGSAPSVRDILTGYDAIVEQLIVEVRAARTDVDQARPPTDSMLRLPSTTLSSEVCCALC